MKYAIAQTSGRQLMIKPGQWYDINLVKTGNLGDYIYLNKILFFRNKNKIQLGYPFLSNARIPAKIIQKVKGEKIMVLKSKPKKRYKKMRGHRSIFSRVFINISTT
jgi:large subunit ribosomal protein L21